MKVRGETQSDLLEMGAEKKGRRVQQAFCS